MMQTLLGDVYLVTRGDSPGINWRTSFVRATAHSEMNLTATKHRMNDFDSHSFKFRTTQWI